MIDRYTITLVSLVFGILHFCVAIMGSLALMRTVRNLHKNHKLLLINLLIGCYMSSTGTLASSVVRVFMLSSNQFTLRTNIGFRILNMFESLGPNIFRLTFIAFTIERAVATRRIYSYELSSPVLGYVLMPLSLMCAFSLSFSYNILNASLTILYAIYISLDTLSLAATLILIALNQKWQSIENISTYYNLSMRYQIFENIRILLFLVRIISLGFTAALMATISSLTIRKLHFTHYTYYARVSYFGIWNIYGLIAGLLLIYELCPKLLLFGPLKRKHKYGLIPHDLIINSDRYFIRLNSSWTKKAQAMNL
uniref:Serpentine receptor class gamma n=1 Tax=Bursaphelenchus xylophilus TaxID=6326 RepID=A0A1I7SLL5_BURXY